MNIGAHSVVFILSSTVQNVLRGLNIVALSVVLELRLCDYTSKNVVLEMNIGSLFVFSSLSIAP